MANRNVPAVVLDTNAALDWLVFADPRIGPLAAAIQNEALRWISTPRLRLELAQVLTRPAFSSRPIRPEQALTTHDLWTQVREGVISPSSHGLICRDPDDQPFLDVAIDEGARWLITRDKALLELRKRALLHGLRIDVPEAWTAEP